MYDSALDQHPHFMRWTDPLSGVTSYALKLVLSPMQRGGYFIAPSLGPYGDLWFEMAYPRDVVSMSPAFS